MKKTDAITIAAGRLGLDEATVKLALDEVTSLLREGEPEFKFIASIPCADGGEIVYESEDGVFLSIWTPKLRGSDFEYGEAEYSYFLREEGTEAVPCSSWAEAIARRDPALKPSPERQTFRPILVGS